MENNRPQQKILIDAWTGAMDNLATLDAEAAVRVEAEQAFDYLRGVSSLQTVARECFGEHFGLLMAQDMKEAVERADSLRHFYGSDKEGGKALRNVIYDVYLQHGAAHAKLNPSPLAAKVLIEGIAHFADAQPRLPEMNVLLRDHMPMFSKNLGKEEGALRRAISDLDTHGGLETPVLAAFLKVSPEWATRSHDFVRGVLQSIAGHFAPCGSPEEAGALAQWVPLAGSIKTDSLQALYRSLKPDRPLRAAAAKVAADRGVPIDLPSRDDMALFLAKHSAPARPGATPT
jgi:hypothetical protein